MTIYPMHHSPRCCAFARTTGFACKAAAMTNGRCRMHGGKSTGPGRGNRNAYKHGMRSAATVDFRREMNEVQRVAREMVREMNETAD